MFDVSNSLIRYWESEFKSLKPTKNRKGDRRFTVKDIDQLNMIYTLVKEKGFTLDGARAELKHLKIKEKKKEELLGKLNRIKNKLTKIQNNL